MHLCDITLPTLAENLALDEAFLLDAEAGGPEVLRLWEWPSAAVVLGAAGRLSDEIEEAACEADAVPIARRSSGGGAVLLGNGCLLYSLILRFDRHPALPDLHASYRHILGTLQRNLVMMAPGVSFEGISDLALDQRKIGGSAQQRKRTHLLHHGTLLYAFDIAPMQRYLRPPPRQPDYRRARPHDEFVTNLPIDAAILRLTLTAAWDARETLSDWPRELTAELARAKYGVETWMRRR